MTLKITKSADPITVDRINLALYGPPGIGKSTLAFTADTPLLLDFDQGAHRAANRKDIVRVTTWQDVAEIGKDDLADYATVIVDTAGRALDVLTADIIRRNPKAGRGGALTLQGYGTLKAEFIAWLKQLNGFGKDVVLVAHMDEQRNGDDIIERLDVQGGSKGEIYKAADAMGRMTIKGGKRMLDFSPTDAAFGKNPGQLLPLEDPHPDRSPLFLAGIMEEIKSVLNTLSEEQQVAQALIAEWRETIAGLDSVETFNTTLPLIKNAPKAAQALFADAAKEKGYTYSKKSGAYEAAQKAAA
jgi:hypothetical protein